MKLNLKSITGKVDTSKFNKEVEYHGMGYLVLNKMNGYTGYKAFLLRREDARIYSIELAKELQVDNLYELMQNTKGTLYRLCTRRYIHFVGYWYDTVDVVVDIDDVD